MAQSHEPFRLALVGAGRMGSTHARALAGSVEIELAAVVEPSDESAARLGAELPRYRGLAELLAADRPDGALVAVPTRLHAEVVSQLLDAGTPVLCEKPLGLTPAEAERLGAQATHDGVLLTVGYWRRFVPELRALRARVRAGELGELSFVFCAQWDERPPPAPFRDPASSGGILVDMGVHEFDLLRWLTGQELEDAVGLMSSVTFDPPVPGDHETATVACRLSGGTTALVSLVRRHPPGDVVRVEVLGTEGVARVDVLDAAHADAQFLAALRAQVQDFVGAVRGRPSGGATAADAVVALRAAEQVQLR